MKLEETGVGERERIEKSGKIFLDCQELNEIKSYWHFTERSTIKGMKGIFRLAPASLTLSPEVAFLFLNFPDT